MEHKFQINLRGIIDLLSEHLYSGPEVYVRELLQNAVDAITARAALEPGFRGEILVECHPSTVKGRPSALVFTDNGVGLTADEVHKFLATIGLSSKRADGGRPTDFIGQFGVGILSCFVVSEQIVLITKSARDPDAKPVEWRAKADGTYTLKELDRDFAPGTQVWLTAKPETESELAPERVSRLAKHFGGLLPYPIRVTAGKVSEIINAGGAPWRRTFASEKDRTKALLDFGSEAFETPFFDAIPLTSAVGQVDGVAFVLPFTPPMSARKAHRVYLKNMFLSDAVDNLLPDWAFFVRAVVNANDLRPTASRESFYEDAKLAEVRTALGAGLRDYLVRLAETRPEKLQKFIGLHHRALKALAAEDDAFFAVIIDYLPFETSLGTMTFGAYRQENAVVRFVPDVDSFRQVAGVTAAQGVCVINAGYADESELLAKVPDTFPEMTVELLDPAAIARGFDDLSPADETLAGDFLHAADLILRPFRCRTEAKNFRPESLPTLYSTTRDARFYRSLEQSKEISGALWSGVLDTLGKRAASESGFAQLCFNFRNPLVRKVATVKDRTRLTRVVEMLYVQALLLGHHPLSARELAVLNNGILALIDDTEGR
ncbi:MAG: HSP90 family protein [Gemmataceae bacterium]|nr:HSP90 family protein [Gemmataceae bacterium]